MGLANIAATNMEHLCNCSAHGYSQSERWGNKSRGTCTVTCEGHTSQFFKGDRDCSSAVIDAWQEALIGTKFEGCLAGATYTGNMRSVFVSSGLFEWKPMSFIAQRGDIYLNEVNHTAMCTSPNPDLLAEFSISETGGTTGQSGDQTGNESHIRGYYDYPWNGILHYNGKADSQETVLSGVTYRVHTANGWTPAESKASSEHWAGDGKPIDAIQLYRADGKQVVVEVMAGDVNLGKTTFTNSLTGKNAEGDGFAGDFGHALTRIALDSPGMSLQVKVNGAWLSPLCDGKTAEGDWFAGDDAPIEGLRCWV